MMRRRAFLQGLLTCAALGTPRLRAAASPAAPSAATALSATPLSEQLLLIRGGGGNVVVLDAPEGVLLVDGGSPEHSARVLQLIKERTGKAIKVLFNTHWHWDQTGSNRTLGPAGVRIIAHENTRLWLGTEVVCKWQQRTYAPLPLAARPNETFYTSGTLRFGTEHIEYGYLPQAHTDGDLFVYFREANVLAAGDVLSVGSYPILDYCTNGWIGGMANATQKLMALCGPDTRVIPGTGPPQTRADLEREQQMLTTLKLRLSKLLAQGMSVRDMLEAAPTHDFDPQWGDPTLFVSNAWPGLVARARELGVAIV
ncbi:MAG TPA: MBL fold metallo-hydrolase [Steroidobacteraceae bacterium]|nr:MBL fold metallo-hydrolase [Steroidobacteraceae bacterium]